MHFPQQSISEQHAGLLFVRGAGLRWTVERTTYLRLWGGITNVFLLLESTPMYVTDSDV